METNWTPRLEITGIPLPSDTIATCVDNLHFQHVVCKGSATGNDWGVYYARRKRNKKWKPTQLLYSQNFPTLPCIAVNQNTGRKLVAWQETFGDTHRIGFTEFKDVVNQPKFIQTDRGQSDYHPSVAVSPDGMRFISFSRQGQIMLAFAAKKLWVMIPVTSVNGQCYYPSVWCNDDSVHVAFANLADGNIYHTRHDKPVEATLINWSTPVVIGKGSGCNLSGMGSVLGVTYTTPDHYVTARLFDGTQWLDPIHLSMQQGGYHSHLAFDSKSNPHATWMQSLGGETYQIYTADYAKGNWSYPIALPEQGTFSEGNDICVDADDVARVVYLEKTQTKQAFSTDRSLL